jgi:hypothetical protein
VRQAQDVADFVECHFFDIYLIINVYFELFNFLKYFSWIFYDLNIYFCNLCIYYVLNLIIDVFLFTLMFFCILFIFYDLNIYFCI